MGLRDLFFSITAQDKTGSAFGSVNKKLRETSGHAASASERIDRLGQKMVRAGAAGSVASAGIFAMFRDSVGLYDEQARSEAKVAQAIKATGGAAGFTAAELKKQASALQGVTRFGDENILNNVTAQLLTFKEISGDTFTRAQTAALDLSTVLDGDLKSASIMLGKALNDPAVGLSAMSRAGVTFTEAQKDMVKGMVESGDMLGAQKLILDEIESAYGGQAKAAREAGAGIYEAWKNTWGDIKEIVGRELLAGLKVVVPILETIVGAFQNLSPQGQRFAVVMGALAVAVPPVTAALGAMAIGIAAVSGPVGAAVIGISALTAAVVTFWPQIQAATDWVGAKFSAALDLASGALAAIPGPIQSVIEYVGFMLNPFNSIIAKVQAFGDLVSAVFGGIPGIVGDVVRAVATWIEGKFNGILDSLGKKIEWVEGKFAWLYDKVVGNSWVPDLVDEIGANFGRLDGDMVKPTDAAVGRVGGAFSGLLSEVSGSLEQTASQGKLTWSAFLGDLHQTGQAYAGRIISDVFDQLAAGLGDALGSVGGASIGGTSSGGGGFVGSLLGGVGSWAKGLLGFAQGGAFTVRGRAGYDRNVASVRLSEGERVRVERKGETSGAGRPVVVHIHTPNPDAFRASRAQIGQQIGRAVAAGSRTA